MPSPTSSDSQADWNTTIGSDESPRSENRPVVAASLPVRHRSRIRQPHKKSRVPTRVPELQAPQSESENHTLEKLQEHDMSNHFVAIVR